MKTQKTTYSCTHYRFNPPANFVCIRAGGKELDPETGNYYYGARYYDPKISVWLSVDPKAHWYPSHSPYNYSLNNPIMLHDPNGQWVEGAGFLRNLFNHDNKILAQDRTAETGGTITRTGWGEYEVNYNETVNVEGQGATLSPVVEAFGHSDGLKRQNGANVYGEGGSSQGSWNSGLIPKFSIDIKDAYWRFFFSKWLTPSLVRVKGAEQALPKLAERTAKILKKASEPDTTYSPEFEHSNSADCYYCKQHISHGEHMKIRERHEN